MVSMQPVSALLEGSTMTAPFTACARNNPFAARISIPPPGNSCISNTSPVSASPAGSMATAPFTTCARNNPFTVPSKTLPPEKSCTANTGPVSESPAIDETTHGPHDPGVRIASTIDIDRAVLHARQEPALCSPDQHPATL